MTWEIVIGNILSLVAACFTAAASWSRVRKHIYWFQFVQCFLLAVASIFFHSYAGMITLLLCSIRNIFLVYDKFSDKMCVLFVVLVLIGGIASNRLGWVGVLPVLATLQYTIGCYLFQGVYSIKWNIFINLVRSNEKINSSLN